jgi:hypothetical protein
VRLSIHIINLTFSIDIEYHGIANPATVMSEPAAFHLAGGALHLTFHGDLGTLCVIVQARVTDRLKVQSTVSSSHGTRGQVRTLANTPESTPHLALWALHRGRPLKRRMTEMERVALAVASAQPTRTATLTTPVASQKELATTWRLFVRRIERRKARPNLPLIYFGSFAEGQGGGGCHLHLVLWERPYAPTYHGQTKALGLGTPHVDRIASTPHNVLRVVSYVLSQQEPIFGTTNHLRHRPREKSRRRFVSPQRKTLEAHCPNLFVALNLAKSRSVSDEKLFAELPKFIREYRAYDFKGDLESELAQAID